MFIGEHRCQRSSEQNSCPDDTLGSQGPHPQSSSRFLSKLVGDVELVGVWQSRIPSAERRLQMGG